MDKGPLCERIVRHVTCVLPLLPHLKVKTSLVLCCMHPHKWPSAENATSRSYRWSTPSSRHEPIRSQPSRSIPFLFSLAPYHMTAQVQKQKVHTWLQARWLSGMI